MVANMKNRLMTSSEPVTQNQGIRLFLMEKNKKLLLNRRSSRLPQIPLQSLLESQADSRLQQSRKEELEENNHTEGLVNLVRNRSKNVLQQPNIRRIFKLFHSKLKQLVVPKYYSPDITEDWEKDGNESSKQADQERYLFVKTSKIYFLIELALFFINVVMIWFVSVQSIYDTEDNSVLPVLWQIMAVLDIFVTLNTTRIRDGREVRNRWGIFQMYIRGEMFVDLLCIAGIVMLTATDQEVKNIVYLFLMAILIVKALAKYSNIKPFLDHNFAKQHMTLVTSFAFLIIMGHIFGIVMYLVGSRANPEKNWINSIKLQHEEWDTKYIFSIYWAFTTMATVGYGDITPQNKYEVITVIVVEILATSIFGYMINIIGMTLNEMKSRNEALQSELTITDKISKCFNIADDLTYRIKSFLRNNHKVDSSFSLVEQTKLIDKLNPVLKQELLGQTNTKVIKKSIFFLMHFSRSLQNKLSIKLTKKIFQPSQPIAKVPGQQALYVINQGNIDISVFRYHKSKIYNKKVRSISSVSNLPHGISLNVYGYTQLLLGRQININATSTVFTIAYQLKKRDFLECLSTCMGDYETICQLREKFIAKGILQSVEVPELIDPREHFYPNKQILTRKNRIGKLQPRFPQANRNTPCFKSITLMSLTEDLQFKQSREAMIESLRLRKNSDSNITPFEDRTLEQLLKTFESRKNYSKYMVNSNMAQIMKKYQKFRSKRIGAFDGINFLKPFY